MNTRDWVLKNKGRIYDIFVVFRSYYPGEGNYEFVTSFLFENDAIDYIKKRRREYPNITWTYEREKLII